MTDETKKNTVKGEPDFFEKFNKCLETLVDMMQRFSNAGDAMDREFFSTTDDSANNSTTSTNKIQEKSVANESYYDTLDSKL